MSVYERRAPFRPWDDRSQQNLLSPDDEVRRVRAYAWIERRLAEVLRNVAAKVPQNVAEALGFQASHHDWHAQVWEEHLARGAEATPGQLPDGLQHVHDLLDAIDELAEPMDAVAAISRVVEPRLIATYTFHGSAVGTDLEADGRRWLDIVLDDEHDARRELELFVQSLLRTPDDAQRLAGLQSRLEAPIVKAGGLVGPGSIGMTA